MRKKKTIGKRGATDSQNEAIDDKGCGLVVEGGGNGGC